MQNIFPFEKLPVSDDWVFKNVRSTERWTHGYHRYPAKFLPNLVKKIIEEHTSKDDIIADLFAGCGTTLVESKVHGRRSIGVDINPVAQLIASVKVNPIQPEKLKLVSEKLKEKINDYSEEQYRNIDKHERIDYWFDAEAKSKIAFLYKTITSMELEKQISDFYLVALSNILKNCSRWLQTSTKPQIDPDKVPSEVFLSFNRQVKSMIKKNVDFFNKLNDEKFLNVESNIYLQDARKTEIADEAVTTVITSPPYVTSYEYADLHQLTGYWFEYITNLREFRKDFIGTFYSYGENIETGSELANEIVRKIFCKHERTAKEVANYVNDMDQICGEMYRILKKDGKAFIVIGNTTYRKIKIQSAEIIAELLKLNGFEISEIIKRSIPFKLIPTIRDEKSGRFTTLKNKNSKKVYPEEYIIIAQK